MSTAIHSVKVNALKGAEIKLAVRALVDDTVSFCPILALRLLGELGATGPVDEARSDDSRATPGDLHAPIAAYLVSARSTPPKKSVTYTLEVRDAAWLKKIKKGATLETTAYAAPTRRVGAAFSADGSQVVAGWDAGNVDAYAVTQKKRQVEVGKPVWSAHHLGLLAFTMLDEDVLVTAGRDELRAHREGESFAALRLDPGATITGLAADGPRALIGFADGSVASWQPGKDKALVRLGALDATVNGLAALDKSSVAASTTTEVAILKKGAIATRVKSEHGPVTALSRGVTKGGLAYGTATGAVVCLKADGALARKHQVEVPQDCRLWFLHRDPRGDLFALARRGNRLFLAACEPQGFTFEGPLAEVEQFSSTPAPDGLVARVNEQTVMYIGFDGSVRWTQQIPTPALRAAYLSPPSYEPKVTRDGKGLILGFTETEKAAELRDPAGAVLARVPGGWNASFSGAIPLGQDAALAWFSDGTAARLSAAGSEKLGLRVHSAAAIERTGGAFALVCAAKKADDEYEDGIIPEDEDAGRLVELDVGGNIVATLATVAPRDVGSTSGLQVSADGSLLSASIYDSDSAEHVPHLWLREGDGFRALKAPWGPYDWPTFAPDGSRIAWQTDSRDQVVLFDPRAGREVARLAVGDVWGIEFDGAGRLVLTGDDRLYWFDGAGVACGELPLPASEIITPPVERLLAGGDEPEVVVATALNAFVLRAKGDPLALRDRDPIASTGSLVAHARGWPLTVRPR
ncbi:hypothetical protein [Nannocystis radixulma]|uniref:WD40 repeat domain-containing protein n=1 Tax=Nannocystis radixulma TaxID=2995305 RepID=A0ABT5BID2_9BACT|nr:hypothetical protein [Nannocystis radixulma]MDC0672726.1 hypothetical protein [Nannocystis radixulma]